MLVQHLEIRHAVELLGGGPQGVGYMLKERFIRLAEPVDALHRVAAGGAASGAEAVTVNLASRVDAMANVVAPSVVRRARRRGHHGYEASW